MNKRCVKQDYEGYKIIALLTIEKGRRKKKNKKIACQSSTKLYLLLNFIASCHYIIHVYIQIIISNVNSHVIWQL